jgi:hypothetical protein
VLDYVVLAALQHEILWHGLFFQQLRFLFHEFNKHASLFSHTPGDLHREGCDIFVEIFIFLVFLPFRDEKRNCV